MGVRVFQNSGKIRRLAGVLGVLSMIALVLRMILRVRSGEGLRPYVSMAGIETNAIQVLATVFIVAALCLGFTAAGRALRRTRATGARRRQ